jgi:erythromycin esterase
MDSRRRKIMRAVVLVAMVAVGCTATSASPPQPSPPATSRAIAAAPGDQALSGTVTRANGEPASGALVALIPHFELEYAGDPPDVPLSVTDARGAYHFATVAPGRYGLTATLAGAAAAYGGVQEMKPGRPNRVDLALKGDSVDVRGTVRDSAGAVVPGARIQAARMSPDEGEVYVAMTDAGGGYSLSLPGGIDYFVVVDSLPRPRAYRQIAATAQSVDFQLEPAPAPRPSDAEIISSLAAQAIPIATLDPARGLHDLAPLRAMIGDARIVAVGEATHGSREFFLVRHRLLELLAGELGFTVLALEGGWSDAWALDDYVVDGKGDPLAALSNLYYWAPNTEEMVTVVRWMRRYNQDRSHKRKLRLQGFDVQFTPHAVAAVLAYLAKVDPTVGSTAADLLSPLRDVTAENTYAELAPAELERTRQGVANLVARFDSERTRWIARSSEKAWTLARQHATMIQRTEALYRTPGGVGGRDAAMADNVQWILEHEPPGTKIVLWAHNNHIATQALEQSDMGERLRARYGKDYFAIGVTFGTGSFRAYDWSQGGRPQHADVGSITLGPTPPTGFEAALGLARLPLFALDLRAVSGPFGAWLDSRVPTRHAGGVFHGEASAGKRRAPKKSYDAVIYIDKVTPSHLNPGTGK